MAARRGPATRGKSEPQGQLAATTTSFGCSAGLSFMDVTKPQLLGVMSFISEMNAQPWLSAGFASQAATSSVTSADKKAPLKGSVVNDGSAALCVLRATRADTIQYGPVRSRNPRADQRITADSKTRLE